MIYPVELSLTVRPVYKIDPPMINLGVNNNLNSVTLTSTTKFDFCFSTHTTSEISVELVNKTNNDPDTAVVIEHLSFFGIADPKFIWAGLYHPIYPEPWATEQKNQNIILAEELKCHDYLGWNGIWRLQFEVPVFTWMHKIQDLGWIYK